VPTRTTIATRPEIVVTAAAIRREGTFPASIEPRRAGASGIGAEAIATGSGPGTGMEEDSIGLIPGRDGVGGSNRGDGLSGAGFRRGRGGGGGCGAPSATVFSSTIAGAGDEISLRGGGISIDRAIGTSPEWATAASGTIIGSKQDEHANGCPDLAVETV
jgi:hypothetical protein